MSVDSLDSNLDLARPVTDRKYVGTVVANEDPLNLDRIQVRVPDLYDPDQGEVPWAGPIKLSPFGQSQDWGVYGVPAIGSDVIIELQDGDPQFPMYESFGRYANPDFPSGKSWGFKDPKGNKFKVDLEADTVEFSTGSGAQILIDADGNISATTPGTSSVYSIGQMSMKSDDKVEITAPETDVIGKLNVNGDVTFTGQVHNNGKNIGSTHTHGGVRSGSDTSGTPNN